MLCVVQGIMSMMIGGVKFYHCEECDSLISDHLDDARQHMKEHNRLK